jgi:hypothetical protein
MSHPSVHPEPRRPLAAPVWRAALAALLTAVLLLGLMANAALAVGGSQFVSLANQYRSSHGLAPVSFGAAVDQVAVERANQMAARDKLEHDLDYVKTRLQQLGVCFSTYGEIIAWERGYPSQSYERTVQQWYDSTKHRAIMLGSYNAAGGSWSVSSSGGTFSVMIFVAACSSNTTASTEIGRMVFVAGTHTGFTFSGTTVTGRKTATLSRASGASVSERAKINGTTYLKVANGIWAGYWVPETGRSHIPGYFDRVHFPTPIRIIFEQGTHTGLKYYSSGKVYARLPATLARRSGADAAGWAIINGQPHYYVINGIWAGYFVPATSRVWPAS